MSDYHVRSSSRDQRGPQTRNLPSRSPSRDMSWRKPVPKLLPSPPISSNQLQLPQYSDSPTATTFGFTMDRANPFSMSLTSLNSTMPPVCGGATPTPRFHPFLLPTDWKENIDRAIKNGTPPVTPIVTSPTHGFTHGYYRTAVSQLQITETDKDQSMFQEVDLGEKKSRNRHRLADKENVPPPSFDQGLKRLTTSYHMNESNTSVCRTPKSYRPPTPPLPSRKRASAPSTPITTAMNKPMHIIYPDLAGLGSEAHSQRTKSPDSDGDITETHTVHTDRSSLTLWTNNRGASLETSTLAEDDADDRTLPVYQPHSVRKSMIGSKAMIVVEPHIAESGFWTSFRLWFDSLLDSIKSCLPGA